MAEALRDFLAHYPDALDRAIFVVTNDERREIFERALAGIQAAD